MERADLIAVNGRYYITAGGLGLPCAVVHIADVIRYRRRWGKTVHGMLKSNLYLLAALYALLRTAPDENPTELRWDDRSVARDPLLLMINNQESVGGNFQISPGAINDDGRFDVCLIEGLKNRARSVATLLRALKGTHIDQPFVKSWRARELDIRADRPVRFLADGEILESNTEFRIRIAPRALKVIAPGAAKSAPAKAGLNGGVP